MTAMRWAGVFACAALAIAPSGAWAHHAGTFTFKVSRDGAPIGAHRVTFRHDGGRVEIEAAMELKVSFAMVPVFRFRHQRHEIWQDGKPVLIDAWTDDDGREYRITVRAHGEGFVRTVNDRVEKLDSSTRILALWNQATVTSPPGSFASVIEDKTVDVGFHYLGKERMAIEGRELAVDHYQMVGEEERDIWYDADGQVARVTFLRDGATIEYLRNEYHWVPLADPKFVQ
ncbi:MAG: hypothetical protein K0S35_247 [Geminicoccaceae bacterium]|nr:hypothetical protein [Geminicoccaceae bacterium]